MMKRTVTHNDVILHRISRGSIDIDIHITKPVRCTLVFILSGSDVRSVRASVSLDARGAVADIVGIAHMSGPADVQIHTLQHHRAPNTTSNLLVKGVLRDSSSLTYDGSIIVDKDAQKTDAYQRNENLLLDPLARAVSSPALEIQANDVRCTHGAVVKTLSNEELWYLSTRGIPKHIARGMIADGFLTSAYTQFIRRDIHDRIAGEMSRLKI